MDDLTASQTPGDDVLRLILVSNDTFFRLGLSTLIQAQAVVQVEAEVSTLQACGPILAQLFDTPKVGRSSSDPTGSPLSTDARETAAVEVVIVLHLTPSLEFDPLAYGQIHRQFPGIVILILGQGDRLPVAPQPGLALLWGQALQPPILWQVLTRIQGGELPWITGDIPSPNLALDPSPSNLAPARHPWQAWWVQACSSGLAQVQETLGEVNDRLQALQPGSQSWIDRQLLKGQRRELALVARLLRHGTGQNDHPTLPQNPPPNPPQPQPPHLSSLTLPPTITPAFDSLIQPEPLDAEQMERWLFDRLVEKLGGSLSNLTPLPLEVDSLNLRRRRELLLVVLQALGDRLVELRHSQLTPEQVSTQIHTILRDLWQDSLTRFFGQYTTLPDTPTLDPLVTQLLQSEAIVSTELLHRIAQSTNIFQTLLFLEPVSMDGVNYRCQSPEALHRLSQLTENLILQVANGVVYPLLNRFSQSEVIKQTFFQPGLLSTRQIDRFRNSLSWKYRFIHTFGDAQDIYESRYWLWVLEPQGIQRRSIYAARQGELDQLAPWQQSLTLSLELRDALAPQLQSLTAWLGRGLVYVLTPVVGRALGLIGRGIMQGLGVARSEWNDRP